MQPCLKYDAIKFVTQKNWTILFLLDFSLFFWSIEGMEWKIIKTDLQNEVLSSKQHKHLFS